MFQLILRIVRVAAVLTIVVTLSQYGGVRPAVAAEEEAARCENAEDTMCGGTSIYPESRCKVGASGCETCVVGSGPCNGHSGHKKFNG